MTILNRREKNIFAIVQKPKKFVLPKNLDITKIRSISMRVY